MMAFFQKLSKISLVKQVIAGLLLGMIFASIWPEGALNLKILGDFFVGALKAVAPVLVFILVAHAVSMHQVGGNSSIGGVLVLYLFGTFAAAIAAALASYLWPVTLQFNLDAQTINPPEHLSEVLRTLLFNMVDNPVHALINTNYIGILTWAILVGITLRHCSESTRGVLADAAHSISVIVSWVVRLAPLGVFGLISFTIADTGFSSLKSYASLLGVLLGAMAFVAFVLNPLMVFFVLKRNPYPLVWQCLTQSGITAFFMRSSAANIPVNLELSRKLGLREETYSISIPLGATINMAGAAITITVLTLATAHSLNIDVHPLTAFLLCLLSTIAACGASGVPQGSLLLIPLACSLFGIDQDIAGQIVGIGVLISVIQDAAETALNSSTDVLFTAAADISAQEKAGLRSPSIPLGSINT